MTNLDAELQTHGLEREKHEPNIVDFQHGSTSHPRNWPLRQRAFDTAVIICIQFVTTSMSTAGTSLGSAARREYGLTRTTANVVFVLTYQLGKMVGSVALPPWSETYGRRTLYIACCGTYAVMSLTAGVVPHVSGAVVGRVLSGVTSSAGGSVAAGSIQEMYGTETRVWVIFLWTGASTSALAVGPIYGSYIADAVGWRWGFYIAAIVMFVLACVCLGLKESRPSCVLRKSIDKVKASTGRTELQCGDDSQTPSHREFLAGSLFRPLYFFFTEPIVTTVVILASIAWALMFLFTESLTVIFALDGFTEVQSSLFFLPILVGIALSTPVRIHDMQSLQRRKKDGKEAKPEDKLFGFALGAPALAIGLWWFAWTTPPAVHTHWIVPSIALALVGFAINEFEYVLGGYLTDAYGTYASSAVGSMSTLRAALAGSFPLFAYFMYTGISTNAASSILAGVATVFFIAPFIFLRYGETLRARSRYTVSDGDLN